jgi:hypothetical protein
MVLWKIEVTECVDRARHSSVVGISIAAALRRLCVSS